MIILNRPDQSQLVIEGYPLLWNLRFNNLEEEPGSLTFLSLPMVGADSPIADFYIVGVCKSYGYWVMAVLRLLAMMLRLLRLLILCF
jgi:hypothetical protein